jgi:hypothetical protein
MGVVLALRILIKGYAETKPIESKDRNPFFKATCKKALKSSDRLWSSNQENARQRQTYQGAYSQHFQ